MTPVKGSHREWILQRIRTWPTQPGVYVMKDVSGRILYVGKAKNLRNRIRSYFQDAPGLHDRTRVLVSKCHEVEFTVTATELEALLLECNLIKKHRPRYNIRLKDDKNYPYVVLDFTHPYPQFRITRKVVVSPNLRYFGPFSSGVNDIARFLLKTFQIRDCSDAKFSNRTRPCLNYDIGICTAPCVDFVSQDDYARQIREASLFLQGKNSDLLKTLKAEMFKASEAEEYEKAKVLRDRMKAVERMSEKQNMIFPEQSLDIDVVGCYEAVKELQWVVLFIRNGYLIGRRAEKTQLVLGSKEETTRSFLEQFYTMSLIPDQVWIAEDFPERELLEEFLTKKGERKIKVVAKRSEKSMRLLGMAYENAKLIYDEARSNQVESLSESLQKALDLPDLPHHIEGIDVSNLQGENPSVALVHFAAEKPLKSRYRNYYPRTVEGQNDFAMIYEVMTRRLADKENPVPDLFLIDGGKGQLASALKALEEAGLEIPILALAKSRTQSNFTLKEVKKSEERIFLPNRKNPLILREGNPALRLLQQVRDEAHRFSVKNHRVRRKKNMMAKG